MGWLEHVLVTPSHHRVHHAINPEYMDKNLSQIFIVWDKLFGTFVAEKKEIPPVYGITRPARTWNPIRINFQHLWLLIKDAWRTRLWKEKLTLWFKPTGYRPADVAERYPVYKIDNVYNFEKYDRPASALFITWSWIQLCILLALISYLFANIAYINELNPLYIYWYGGVIFLTVFALTELMDQHPQAIGWEAARTLLALGLLYWQKDWFGASQFFEYSAFLALLYFLLSLLVTFWFWKTERRTASVSIVH
jgi:hypothetical protein